MDDAITKSIIDSIKTNLPQQVGDVLQKELSALKEARTRVEMLEGKVSGHETHIKELLKKVEELNGKLMDHAHIDGRIKAVAERELVVGLVDERLKSAQREKEMLLTVVGMVFKSPVYQQQVSGTIPLAGPGGYPGSPPAFTSAPFLSTSQTKQE
jgi:hypothetical protein